MKIALVHDWLNHKVGGGERVLLKLAELYPEAPIYTLLYDPRNFGQLLPPARIRSSFLQKLPRPVRSRPRYLLPLVPKAIESFDFGGFDVVLSSSVAFAKNIKTPPTTLHICYCHSPMRFAWDYAEQYMDEQAVGPLRRKLADSLVQKIRAWDRRGVERVDAWVANSHEVAKRIEKYYHRRAHVIYPPVETGFFSQAKTQKRNYYVTLAVLTPYKKIDLAIEAFNVTGERLVVIGDGPDRKRLAKLAKPNIRFVGYVHEARRRELLGAAKALIHPQVEDFGIAAVEAMAAGTPVIAYAKGGATETVIDSKTGMLFSSQTPASLNRTLEQFQQLQFDIATLRTHAKQFDERVFRSAITTYVKAAYARHVQAN